MHRSSKADQARLVNAAYRLLAQQTDMAVAAETLSRKFALSRRQAYRYVAQAAALHAPVPAVERTVAVTFKLPVSTVRALRAYARRSGQTLSEIVTRALAAVLGTARRHG